MDSVLKLVRGENWLNSKIPPLLTIACLQLLVQPVVPLRALGALMALLISAGALAAYAHLLNDIFDLEQDLRAGKDRAIRRLAGWQRPALVMLLGVVGFVPWLFVPLDLWGAILLGCIYLTPILYAAPPIRLKERAGWGILADACMAHLFPTLFVLVLFAGLAETHATDYVVMVLAAGWALAFGLRGIVVHQLWDRTDDIAAGVQTFVVQVGSQRARRLVTWVIFPFELGTLLALAVVVYPVAPAMLWVILLAVALDAVRFDWRGKMPFDPAPLADGSYIALTRLYQLWLPLVLAATLALQDPVFISLFVVELILWHGNLKQSARGELYILAAPLRGLYRSLKVRLTVWYERRFR